jgi:hypothetical protein
MFSYREPKEFLYFSKRYSWLGKKKKAITRIRKDPPVAMKNQVITALATSN